MASVIGTFVPTYQGLSATDFIRSAVKETDCFPFNVPHRLPFYRARNAIYHLFRALIETNPGLTVLAPDYNSGNEILAMRAAGATLRYCPVRRDLTLDPGEVERHCREHNPDLLYVIHYAGWPQPMAELVDLCRRRGMLLVKNAPYRSSASVTGVRLGSLRRTGRSSACTRRCPSPNGRCLSAKRPRGLDSLERSDSLPTPVRISARRGRRNCWSNVSRGRANWLSAPALQAVQAGCTWVRAAARWRSPARTSATIGFKPRRGQSRPCRRCRDGDWSVFDYPRLPASGRVETTAGSAALPASRTSFRRSRRFRTACVRSSSRWSCPTNTPRHSSFWRVESTHSSSGTTARSRADMRWARCAVPAPSCSGTADPSGPDVAAYRSHRQAGQQPATSGWPRDAGPLTVQGRSHDVEEFTALETSGVSCCSRAAATTPS
jgi:hypothetical protein